jgi:D-xylose transport system ATP-binding protein
MPYIDIENVSINFGVVQALKNVSFTIEKGSVIALCGENGAGKSTLAKVIAGVYPHGMYSGQIIYNGKEIKYSNPLQAEKDGIGIVYQELNQFNDMTVGENIFMCDMPKKNGVVIKKKMFDDAQQILDNFKIGVRAEQLMRELSVSKRQLIDIVKAVRRNCEVIIFDEATSSLTENEVEFLFELIRDLKKRSITMLYVTHKLSEVFDICDEIVVLKDGEFVNRAMVKDATQDMLIKWMIGRELTQMFPKYAKEDAEKPVAMELKDWSVTQNKEEIISFGDFKLKKGEILGFYGLVGAGRTELMESIFCGKDISTKGHLFLDGKQVKIKNTRDAIVKKIGMLTEDRKLTGLIMTGNIRENIAVASLSNYAGKIGVIKKPSLKEAVLKVSNKLKVKAPSIEVSVTKLSGGNQQKVVLSKWLMSNPQILILDEPTKGIDVGTKMEIYFMLRDLANQGISIIFISSEMTELIGECDRMYVMKSGKIVAEVQRDEFSEETLIKFAM